MDGFPPTCPVLSTHPLCCASPGTAFATVHRTGSLIRSPLSSPLNSSLHTEEHSLHTCISVPIGECVLEEMSLWCLYPMYVPSNVHSHHVKSVVVYRFQ